MAGLEEIYEWAKEFRHDFAPDQSLADVIAFLGVEALKRSGSLISKYKFINLSKNVLLIAAQTLGYEHFESLHFKNSICVL